MTSETVYRRIVEVYVSIKAIIAENIQEHCASAKIRIIHLIVNEWTCQLLRYRFITIRFSYTNENFNVVSALLTVRHFDRKAVSDELMTDSEVLLHWVKGVLLEFGISQSMIFSATTEAGPDVRCITSKSMGIEWE